MNANLPQQWLDKATEDLTVAQLLFQERHFAHVCFLSQQCIEKALKAYLIAKLNEYPRIHNLTDLLNRCVSIEPGFSQFATDCARVDQYYIPTRYPVGVPGGLSSGQPSPSQAEAAIDAAEYILQYVINQLDLSARD